jgi:hypothetical protein
MAPELVDSLLGGCHVLARGTGGENRYGQDYENVPEHVSPFAPGAPATARGQLYRALP